MKPQFNSWVNSQQYFTNYINDTKNVEYSKELVLLKYRPPKMCTSCSSNRIITGSIAIRKSITKKMQDFGLSKDSLWEKIIY